MHTAHDASPQDHSQPQPTHAGRTPHVAGHGLILLMMGIMMPEICWDRKFDNKHRISCILLVFSLKIFNSHLTVWKIVLHEGVCKNIILFLWIILRMINFFQRKVLGKIKILFIFDKFFRKVYLLRDNVKKYSGDGRQGNLKFRWWCIVINSYNKLL